MSVDVWTSAAFHAEARAWVSDALRPLGLTPTGEVEQPHARTWSSALRFATTAGEAVWLKVNGIGTRYEPALLEVLADQVPDLAPQLLAVDLARGWSLTRDAGPTLRAALAAEDSWPVWERLLVRYADAQLTLADHGDAVRAAGVDDLSPARLPAVLRALLDDLASRPVESGGLAEDDARALRRLLPAYDAWCAELAAAPVPDSVQHDDLHSANVCLPAHAPARVIDWGDASWGCPLATMLTTMRSLAFHAGLFVEGQPVVAPQVLRARDAYLEPFTAYASRADLLRWVDLAGRIGCVSKAVSYRRALDGAGLEAHAALEFPVRAWLLDLLTGGSPPES